MKKFLLLFICIALGCNSIMLQAVSPFAPQSVKNESKQIAALETAQKNAKQRRIEENLKRFNDVRKTIADIKKRFENNNVYEKILAEKKTIKEKINTVNQEEDQLKILQGMLKDFKENYNKYLQTSDQKYFDSAKRTIESLKNKEITFSDNFLNDPIKNVDEYLHLLRENHKKVIELKLKEEKLQKAFTELSDRKKGSQITTLDTFAELFNQGCFGPLSKITSDKQSLQKIDPILLKEATNESVRLYKKIVEVGSGIVDECLITRNFKSCQTVVNFCNPHNFLKKDPAAKDTIEMFDKMKDRMLLANPNKFCYHWTGFDFPPIDLVAKVANHTIVPATKLSYNLTLGAAPKVIDWSGEMSSTWWDSINEGHSFKSTYDLAAAGAGTYIAYRILKSVWNKHKTTNSLLEKMIAVGKGCIDTDVVAGLACALFGSTIHLHIYNRERKNNNRYDTDCTALDVGSRVASALFLAGAYNFIQNIDDRTPDVPAPAVGSDGSTSRGNIKQIIRDCLAFLQSRIS
jgi:hypothetical protein